MLGYLDKTFCPLYRTCTQGDTCHRALTDEIYKDAERWWGNGEPPICVFIGEPECYARKSTKQGEHHGSKGSY